jgi:hypothetical protein
LGLGNGNINGALTDLFLRFRSVGEPFQRFLEIAEGLHLQATEPADKGKVANPAEDIVPVEHGESLLLREAGFTESEDERREFRFAEVGFPEHGERAQIQQGTVKTTFTASLRQGPERLLAGFKIEVFMGVEADELTGLNNLQI